MIVKWYHFVLLVTLANANPIGNPAEEQFLKKYFNSGFEFKSDEEKSFKTVSNYAKVSLEFSTMFKEKCDKIPQFNYTMLMSNVDIYIFLK